MNGTDSTLLELAAKAAGHEIYWSSWNESYYVTNDVAPSGLIVVDYRWNPLDDDGDALRLAVRLRLTVEVYARQSAAGRAGGNAVVYVNHFGMNDAAATRRAIVKCAAASMADPIHSKDT